MTDIYRTVYEIEVFSRGPFIPEVDFDDPFGLEEINRAIVEGPCIGMIREVSSEMVQPALVEAELLRIGNDGSFFDNEEE